MPALTRPAPSGRRGFTLVELLVVVALLLPVALLATSLAVQAAREATAAGVVAAVEASQEAAAGLLEAELANLTAGDGVLAVSPTAVRYRARRATGRWCLVDTLGVVVPLGGGLWAASRLPVPGRDSVVVFVTDSSLGPGARPLRLSLLQPPSAAACPGGGAGLRLLLDSVPVARLAGDLVLTEEVVEVASYLSAGEYWIGLVHLGLGTPIEPVAGPFGPSGVTFTGLDSGGVATVSAGLVFRIQVDLGSASPLARSRRLLVGLRG